MKASLDHWYNRFTVIFFKRCALMEKVTIRRNNNAVEVPFPITLAYPSAIPTMVIEQAVNLQMTHIFSQWQRQQLHSVQWTRGGTMRGNFLSVLKSFQLYFIDKTGSQMPRRSGRRTAQGLMLLSQSLRLHHHGAALLGSLKFVWMKLKFKKNKLKSITFSIEDFLNLRDTQLFFLSCTWF